MKKIILVLLLLPLMGMAQTTIHDSMVMGANYANQVYYSMANGKVSTAPVNNWHIAMVTNTFDAGIWANETQGVTVYLDTNTTNLSKVDTTGMAKKWPVLNNPDSTWSVGAFNAQGFDGYVHYGWGNYNTTSHNVEGVQVFVLKIVPASGPAIYRKIKFEVKQAVTSGKLNAGDIVFHYASLDSTINKRDTMRYNKWKNKLMAYYDLIGDSFVNREPDLNKWDLTMTKFMTYIPYPGIEYPVTGVLQNYYSNFGGAGADSVVVAKAAHVDVNTVKYPTNKKAYSHNISTIGYTFVTYSGTYTIVDSLAYFVKSAGNIYKLVATYFVGSADGKLKFDKTLVYNAASTNDIARTNGVKCIVAGNPVTSGNIHLLTDNAAAIDNAVINISDLAGKVIKSIKVGNIPAGFHAWEIAFDNVANGMYIIQVTNNTNTLGTTRAVIAR